MFVGNVYNGFVHHTVDNVSTDLTDKTDLTDCISENQRVERQADVSEAYMLRISVFLYSRQSLVFRV